MAGQVTQSKRAVQDASPARRSLPIGGEPPSAPRTAAGGRGDISILGVPFASVHFDEAVERIRGMMGTAASHQVVIANAHTLNVAYSDPAYRRVLEGAALVLRDGVGVELAAALRGRRLPHNFVGTDFVPALLERLAEAGVRVFLYGAAPGIADAAARVLEARCPGIIVAGVQHGYENGAAAVSRIRAARPDVLLVALGNPLQEHWIAEHLDQVDARVAIGVGALFDYLAGRVPRAPGWMRRLRGEWLFRLAVEPRRLWRRYLVGNVQFLWRVVRSRLDSRRPFFEDADGIKR